MRPMDCVLTHWSLGYVVAILKFYVYEQYLWNCSQVNATVHLPWKISIGVSLPEGLMSSGNKPLPDPVLAKIYVTICCHYARVNRTALYIKYWFVSASESLVCLRSCINDYLGFGCCSLQRLFWHHDYSELLSFFCKVNIWINFFQLKFF